MISGLQVMYRRAKKQGQIQSHDF